MKTISKLLYLYLWLRGWTNKSMTKLTSLGIQNGRSFISMKKTSICNVIENSERNVWFFSNPVIYILWYETQDSDYMKVIRFSAFLRFDESWMNWEKSIDYRCKIKSLDCLALYFLEWFCQLIIIIDFGFSLLQNKSVEIWSKAYYTIK